MLQEWSWVLELKDVEYMYRRYVCVNGPGRIAEALFGSTVDPPLAVSLFAEQSVPDCAK